ncbi:hypothetical protein DPX16_14673 [Anabarilius grahami]|uniref:Uncharacterized protein n=1 Tax=Anabarilius grahami TaxID=495550 RepID=A0A3N0XP83_ANAGA|nr:hypothetical protein DPX16_14673 [Anabarilius grahami]
MISPDPFQEIVDSLRRILTTTPPAANSITTTTTSSPTVVASPMAKPAPFSGSVEECNRFLLQCLLALLGNTGLESTESTGFATIKAGSAGDCDGPSSVVTGA